ncbi:flagellar FLiS export co-chaperone [Campylobacter sp. US33a]|uniref:flagellar FLiS export co-chaperone n=1 Tax=Campylobacter sp. US33a TaxID=2498120 RepID=UPI0010680F27|nr:flagellar FLiS export co-chaperone [Campylobacter sp. US33a]TEY03895.1 hypothetical protein ELQ16_01230 [Campylobacter sp. US33a]
MSKELKILEQHLGKVQAVGEFKASQICTQINDANDFIGALQVLDLALRKIHTSISTYDTNLDESQKGTLDANISQFIQNCSFMGTALFDNAFNVYVGQKLFEFEISNPLLILQKYGYEGVLAYVEDKREELKGILGELASIIAMGIDTDFANALNSTNDLKKIFY